MSKEDVELLPVGRAKKRQLCKVKVVALTLHKCQIHPKHVVVAGI